jgi:CHASE2 domain-containing sensor protein
MLQEDEMDEAGGWPTSNGRNQVRALLDWIDRTAGRVFYRLVGTVCGVASFILVLSGVALFRAGQWEGIMPLLGALLFGALAWHCWRPDRRMSDTDGW